MKLLFYVRQARGEMPHIAKHPDYILHDEPNQEELAFFESPKPVKMIARRLSVDRIDHCITSLNKTLPHVCTTIELIDRASQHIGSKDIYIYLGLGDDSNGNKVICAFSTFDRFNLYRHKVILKSIFDKIANDKSNPHEIFDYQDNRRLMRACA